jgi:hypothetical protein
MRRIRTRGEGNVATALRHAAALLFTVSAAAPLCAEERDGEDVFVGFAQLLSQYGWEGAVYALPNGRATVPSRRIELRFAVPEPDGYYPRVEVTELTYATPDNIPLQDGQVDQLYCDGSGCGRTIAFPIAGLGSFFREDSEYLRWLAYRRGRQVYIVHTIPARQSIAPMFDCLVAYMRGRARSDAAAVAALEQKLAAAYAEAQDHFEAVKALQSLLVTRGEYRGKADGMFGLSTVRALQTYLRQKAGYTGPIDGQWQQESRAAWRRLQTTLSVQTTGNVNLETVRAIERQPTP